MCSILKKKKSPVRLILNADVSQSFDISFQIRLESETRLFKKNRYSCVQNECSSTSHKG
jgi:hypothetical protein